LIGFDGVNIQYPPPEADPPSAETLNVQHPSGADAFIISQNDTGCVIFCQKKMTGLGIGVEEKL
jgi:hypothetical protein